MNLEDIHSILPENFMQTDFSKKEGLVKVEQRYKEKIVSNYFIDFDSNFVDFDIKSYQEKFISDAFFNAPGNLQWNFYLIFLRENFSNEFKSKIEGDINYARKFVFNKDEFEDYLKYEKSKYEEEIDIVGEWKIKLDLVGLQEVYSDEDFNKAIPRFISGKTIKPEKLNKVNTPLNKDQDFTLSKINTINLNDNYRKYPEKRSFNFGRVNLITGVNGTGKTSLLEAIELVITGNHQRGEINKKFNNSVNAVYTSIDGDLKDSNSINSLKKYKARDYYWYNRPISKFNELVRSFNRYNLYNSDSAYKLANSPNKTDFLEYLSNIALGPEFGTIQKRLVKFRQDLNKESRRYKKITEDAKTRKSKAKKSVESFKQVSDPNLLLNSFLKSSKAIGWKKFLPKTIDDNTSSFEEDYKSLLSLVNTILQNKAETEKSTSERLEKILDLKNTVLGKIKILSEASESFNSQQKIIRSNEKLIDLLRKATELLSEPDILKIKTIEDEIDLRRKKIDEFKKYYEELKNFDIELKTAGNLKFIDHKSLLKDNLKLKTEEKSILVSQLSILKSTIDKLNAIISDLKYYGKQYLEHKENVDSCPLCESIQTKNQLKNKIEKRN